MTTPIQNHERHRLDHLNGRVTHLNEELKSSQNLDRRYYQPNSTDTRNLKADLGDALELRGAVKRDLETRRNSSNTSPREKAHADQLLGKIRDAESRERNDRITGRAGTLTERERKIDRNGILRVAQPSLSMVSLRCKHG